jgi:hypothetical protein
VSADITRNHHGGNPESNAAHRSIVKVKDAIRNAIVSFVRYRGCYGATSDEVETLFGWSHQTVSARITEAKANGDLIKTTRKRPTRSGRNAAVLVTPEHLEQT